MVVIETRKTYSLLQLALHIIFIYSRLSTVSCCSENYAWSLQLFSIKNVLTIFQSVAACINTNIKFLDFFSEVSCKPPHRILKSLCKYGNTRVAATERVFRNQGFLSVHRAAGKIFTPSTTTQLWLTLIENYSFSRSWPNIIFSGEQNYYPKLKKNSRIMCFPDQNR